jgi:hypothetical protein
MLPLGVLRMVLQLRKQVDLNTSHREPVLVVDLTRKVTDNAVSVAAVRVLGETTALQLDATVAVLKENGDDPWFHPMRASQH